MRSIKSFPIALCLLATASAAQTTLYSTDFTTLDGWTVTTGCLPTYAWAADATPAFHPGGPFVSAPASLNFNDGINIGGDGAGRGAVTCGWVKSGVIDLSLATGVPRLRYLVSVDTENDCLWDLLELRILAEPGGAVLYVDQCVAGGTSAGSWHAFDIRLERSWGPVRIEFGFETGDQWLNDGTGPFIDDLEVVDITPPPYTPKCLGDGSGTPCPCGNTGAAGAGCANSTGQGALLLPIGSVSVAAGDLELTATHLRPFHFGTYLQGNNSLNGGNGVAFGDGLRCAGGSVVRLQQVMAQADGSSFTTIDIATKGGVSPGDTRTYQLWYRDPFFSPCGTNFNLTNGVELTWVP